MNYDLVEKNINGKNHVFLLVDNYPVSYAKYDSNNYHTVILMDIETRLGFRNHGYATKLLDMIMSKHNTNYVYYNGDFTIDGYNFIRKSLVGHNTQQPLCDSQSFIKDWDNYEILFP